ncbi:MAG TPA: histidine kinase [Chryseolinea sp.]|nr:histidine kinase [Chryseolinea sp.]
MKKIYIKRIKSRKPILIGIIVFLVLTIITQLLTYHRYLRNQDQVLQKINQEADFIKDKLQAALSFSLSATKTLAFLVKEYGVPKDFASTAKEILESNKYIDAIELTREGVITHVYPLEGNESALGYNILNDPATRKEALKALDKKELYFAGPLTLKQGGQAVVGRLPIFQENNFLGFSAVLVKLSTLLKAAGIDSLQNKNFVYQLSKVNPTTGKEQFFLPATIPHEKRHVATVEVPDGEWKLYVMQKNKEIIPFDVLGFALLGLVLSVTAGVFAGYLIRQPQKLNELVKEKTSQWVAEKNLSESIINSMPGVFYLCDRNGNYIRWNKNLELVSGYTPEEIKLMHPLDFFRGGEVQRIKDKIAQVFENKKGEITAYLVTKEAKKVPHYFNGRRVDFNGVEYLIGVGIDISDRVEIERKLRDRTEEIQKLTAHLEKIQEEERTRIAREIHDELGQQLTCLKMDAAWIGKKISLENKLIHQKLSSMISVIDDTVKSVRRISSELRPGILDDLGLIPALEWQSQEFEKRTGIRSIYKSYVNEFNPSSNISTNIFRVYQEALTNIARHAQATFVETTLEETEGHLVLTVRDNGLGIDKAEASVKESFGLLGMRERALLFHGELSIEGKSQKGTIVTLRIPLLKINPK